MSILDIDAEMARPIEPHESLLVPEAVSECPGIMLDGKLVRSFLFSTDVAVIAYCNADAVLGVYPYSGHPVIMRSLLSATDKPVITGVGGSVTSPARAIDLAKMAQEIGIAAVVVNMSFDIDAVSELARSVDIPVMVSVGEFNDAAAARIDAGASLVNVAAGKHTADTVAAVRAAYPNLPIMASGGPKNKTIRATVAAGADAVSWTPPNIQDIEHALMKKVRKHDAAEN